MPLSILRFFNSLGKYRTLMGAVALFVLLDLMVLAMNFVIASGLSENAVAVNLAGRQRMLSQRMTKSIIQIENALQQRRDPSTYVDELNHSRTLFDTTLSAFDKGGITFDGQQQQIWLEPAIGNAHRQVIVASTLWRPINLALLSLTQHRLDTHLLPQVSDARTLLETQNNTLLQHMNTLTTTLEAEARSQANTLRAVQTGGIVLALINFCLILFHFVRELRAADDRTDAAHKETDEILQTVADGLFLVDHDLRIGSQYSQALKTLLDIENPAGKTITELLQDLLSAEDLKLAQDYIALLFEPHVNERLIGTLNPLQEVPTRGAKNQEMQRYLGFQFKRVTAGGQLLHLLVTVNDVTARVTLARTRHQRNEGTHEQLGLISVLCKVDQDALKDCLADTRSTLESLNQRLRNANRSRMDDLLIAGVARALHTIKGEVACMGLQRLELCVHDAETELAQLRQQPRILGDQCLPLIVKIETIFKAIDEVEQLAEFMANLKQRWLTQHHLPAESDSSSRHSLPLVWNDVTALAQHVAKDQGKRVILHWEPAMLEKMPEAYWPWLKKACIQLVRNAIVHGIETPDMRAQRGKPAMGALRLQVRRESPEAWVFSVKDDGQGLDVDAIREMALQKGLITPRDADAYTSVQILSLIFESGFSTASQNLHAGMGVGLDLVRTIARSLGGRLRVSTRKNSHCEISLVLPAIPKLVLEEERHASADRG